MLADAKQVKNLPGRPKRDPSDSRWLAACFERGAITVLLRGHPGVPDHPAAHPLPAGPDRGADPGEAAARRSCWNQRRSSSPPCVTDLHGVTGRDIMDHLIAGERNPKVLAQLARARGPPQDQPSWKHALEGAEFFTAEHAALLAKAMLARIDRLTADIDQPDRGDRAAAGPVRGTAAAGRVDARLGTARRPGRRRRDRRRHDQVPHRRRTWPPGPAAPRWTTSPASAPAAPGQERQPVPGRHHRRDRRRGRPDPDPRRRPLPAARPQPRQGQSPASPSATPS